MYSLCYENAMENFRLRIFRAVVQSLNFRVAAESLLLTQPAVSQQIKALESELATPLFDRSNGRISLTPAGTALLPFAQKLKQLSDEAREAVAGAAGTAAGELSIGASLTLCWKGQKRSRLALLVAEEAYLDRNPAVVNSSERNACDEDP